ncbi:MAG: hypothetical protein GX443_07520 [Deltaproteobacteria bacterium]|nr:hypothetical protein [Deltaproteobacteria bacterium]
MTGILNMARGLLLKTVYFLLQYGMTTYHWFLRFFKIRLHSWRKCGAQKALEKALKELGTSVYSLYARDEGDWQNAPAVQRQLKEAKEAEEKVMRFDESKEAITLEYSQKKEQIREKYSEKRAQIVATEE